MLIVNLPSLPAGMTAGQNRRIEMAKPPHASRTHLGVARSLMDPLTGPGSEPRDTDCDGLARERSD
jgi:hypothetical protein